MPEVSGNLIPLADWPLAFFAAEVIDVVGEFQNMDLLPFSIHRNRTPLRMPYKTFCRRRSTPSIPPPKASVVISLA